MSRHPEPAPQVNFMFVLDAPRSIPGWSPAQDRGRHNLGGDQYVSLSSNNFSLTPKKKQGKVGRLWEGAMRQQPILSHPWGPCLMHDAQRNFTFAPASSLAGRRAR